MGTLMSHQVKSHHVDMLEGRHYIVLHDPETNSEHHIAVYVNHDTCPTCGHVQPKTNTGELDIKAVIRDEIANLEQSKAQVRDSARKHNVPLLRADGKAR